MTVRVPLVYNGSQLQQMKTSDLNNIYGLAVYYYSLDPSRVLAVSGSGGNITSIDDTRLQAGASSTASGSFPNEATTAEPSTVTVSYQRITQSAETSNITTSDSGKTYPVFWTGTKIQAMTETDFVDTFILPAINLLSGGTTTSDQAGTYFISTSDSVTGATLVSSTPVFTDTRADTSAYTADGIGETVDQPTTINNYYLHIIDGVLGTFNPPLQIDSNNDLKQYSTAAIGALFQEYIRHHVVNSSAGYEVKYNIDGSLGTLRGSAMVDTRLSGGDGNYQTRFVSAGDYRAQEFPDGTPATIATYSFKIEKS